MKESKKAPHSLPTGELRHDTPKVFVNDDDSAYEKNLCRKEVMRKAFMSVFANRINPNQI